jgi:hypothetical protein
MNVAIVRSDGSVTQGDEEKATELASFWGKTFEEKHIDKDDASAFLREFGGDFNFKHIRPPDQAVIEGFLKRARRSAPGPDGLPYGAWRATKSKGSGTLFRVLQELSNGAAASDGFNDSLGIYPAKGTQDDDSESLGKRAASDTRPLSCKNCDNKTLAGSVNHTMTPHIAKHADEQQEGFVKGRNGLNNVITIDCHSRAVDAQAADQGPLAVELTPLLLLFDFAAAFPSLAHAFIFAALAYYQVPVGMYNFFITLYTANKCYGVFGGVKRFLYDIFSGILQGCPSSGSLFVLAIDPLLRMFKVKLEGARTKAFADDLATVLRELRQIITARSCFERFRKISGLALKPKKCKILPLGAKVTPALKISVADFVAANIPDWKDFQVTDAGEYLGFQVGQAGGTVASWRKPLAKFDQRIGELAAAGVSAAVGTRLYKSKVATVTSYIEQLCPPPPEYLKLEQSAIEKTLHCPHNTLPTNAAFRLEDAGMYKFPSLALRALAAQARTAKRTCSCWRKELDALNDVRKEVGPAINLAKRGRSQMVDYPWWASEAYADVLERADRLEVPTGNFNERNSLQAAVYDKLLRENLRTDLAEIVKPRIDKHFANLDIDSSGDVLDELRLTLQVAKSISSQAGWAVLRTWCNGWVTASRMGGKKRDCVFGCCASDAAAFDSLRHYLLCPALWRPIIDEFAKACKWTWDVSVQNSLALRSGDEPHHHDQRTVLISALTVAVDTYNVFSRGAGQLASVVRASMNRFLVSRTIIVRPLSSAEPNLQYTADDPKPDTDLTATTPHAQLVWGIVYDNISFNRDNCEPECDGVPLGSHHPNCSQYYLTVTQPHSAAA